jgi:2-succinyl-5-enolpyruvyl-6-hydroxy-3-cyclohexene-1-carboxylate synthase
MATQATFCATLVDEWARAGLRHAVIAPGSRSTPLALALARESRFCLHVRLDERSAAFCALGIGLRSGLPAVLLTTSGTAATEVHAAVVEAHQAGVPLIVVTADRPPELQQVGAPQTIDQSALFSGVLRHFFSAPVPDEAMRSSWRSVGSRAVAEALFSPSGPGPVHLNLAFREPFEDVIDPLPEPRGPGAPWHEVLVAPPEQQGFRALEELVSSAKRPLLLAGGGAGPPGAILAAAASAGWPLLADPRSGCRRTVAHKAVVVAAFDSMLRAPGFASAHRPDLVIRLGAPAASKVLSSWLGELASSGVPEIVVDPYGRFTDPGREASAFIRARPEVVLSHLGAALPEASWASSWGHAEQAAEEAIELWASGLEPAGGLPELLVARRLSEVGVGTIMVSSSMPVRHLEWFSAPSPSYPAVYANRGANGIDGVSSTALGLSVAGAPAPVVGLTGDLAFLHDATALFAPATGEDTAGSPCGLVVIDNGGGGIFSYLAQAESLEEALFERLFGTPQRVDLAGLATAAGCQVTEATSPKELNEALVSFTEQLGRSEPGRISQVLICRSERKAGPVFHDQLNAAVAAVLS